MTYLVVQVADVAAIVRESTRAALAYRGRVLADVVGGGHELVPVDGATLNRQLVECANASALALSLGGHCVEIGDAAIEVATVLTEAMLADDLSSVVLDPSKLADLVAKIVEVVLNPSQRIH